MKQVTDPYLTKEYPRSRLWGSLFSIGFNLILIWLFWWFLSNHPQFLPEPTLLRLFLYIPIFYIVLLILNLPLEYYWGYVLEKQNDRYEASFQNWLCQWFSGAIGTLVLQIAGGYLIAYWVFQYPYAMALIFIIPYTLFFVQKYQFDLIPKALKRPFSWPKEYQKNLKTELKRLELNWPDEIYLYESEDDATINGGLIGFGESMRLMISSVSIKTLEPRELAILIMREIRFTDVFCGYKHFIFGVLWSLVGFLLATSTAEAVFALRWEKLAWASAFITTWYLVSLPIFSLITRMTIYRIDRSVTNTGISVEEYSALLRKLHSYNWTPYESFQISEALFFPVPSLVNRLERLKKNKKSKKNNKK